MYDFLSWDFLSKLDNIYCQPHSEDCWMFKLLHDCVIAALSVLWSCTVSLRCLKLKDGRLRRGVTPPARSPASRLLSCSCRGVADLCVIRATNSAPPPTPTHTPLQLFTSEALNLLSYLPWRYGVSEATHLFMFQTLERTKSRITVSLCALVRSSEGG